jgi:hypothetical protein
MSKWTYLLLAGITSGIVNAQIPLLSSNPTATTKVIYLDFDGQKVSGTLWNSGALVNAAPSGASAAQIVSIWKRVSEDFRPFDVNITTDSTKFNNASTTRRMRVVFTPTSAWYGSAGGVAYLNSFTWGGTPGTPCWVFENQLGYSPKNMAEAASHEAGHTLSLRHQSTYTAGCVKSNEYNPGIGTGVTSWAPIMGVGYSKNVTIWHSGTNANSCTSIQNDHGSVSPGITGNSFLSFLPDDVGNTYNTGKLLNLNSLVTSDSGLITTPADIDVYKFSICSNRYVTFNIKPFALDTINYSGANLDIRLHIYNSAGTLLSVDTTLSRLNALRGLNLPAGSYYFTIDGGRSNNYTDYGSLGKYFITVRATNPPTFASAIVTSSACAGQNAILTSTSNGTPTSYLWTVTSGTVTSNYSTATPSVIFSAGVSTITLITANSTATSCPFTRTISVLATPVINVSGAQTMVCGSQPVILTATGASAYTWAPGSFVSNTIAVSPSVTTIYSVTGSNGSCAGKAVKTVTVSPSIQLTLSASSNQLCFGESVTLTTTGGSSYTYQAGFTINPYVVTPTVTTSYVVFGSVGACTGSTSLLVNVTPDFLVSATVSENFLCRGETALITSNGASSYTINPGGLVGKFISVAPASSTNYTITGANGNCEKETNLFITVDGCDVGVGENEGSVSKFYPNPASNELHVRFNKNCAESAIYNALGQKVQQVVTDGQNESVFSIHSLPAGVYFITFAFSDGGSNTRRFIIQ